MALLKRTIGKKQAQHDAARAVADQGHLARGRGCHQGLHCCCDPIEDAGPAEGEDRQQPVELIHRHHDHRLLAQSPQFFAHRLVGLRADQETTEHKNRLTQSWGRLGWALAQWDGVCCGLDCHSNTGRHWEVRRAVWMISCRC